MKKKQIKSMKVWVRKCHSFCGGQEAFIYKSEKKAREGQYPCCTVFYALITPIK